MVGLGQRDLAIVLLSILVGASLLTVNFATHEMARQKFSTTYQDDPDAMTITPRSPAQVTFRLDNPEVLDQVTMQIEWRSVGGQTLLTPAVNDQSFSEVGGVTEGDVYTQTIQGDTLRRVNTIEVEGAFTIRGEASIQRISITGVSGTQQTIYLVMNLIGLFIIIGPVLAIKYLQYAHRQELEEQFPSFLRDVVEGARAGMSLPQAIRNTKNNSYGGLTPYVEAMAAKLEWGIPFETVMRDFAQKSNSSIIRRAVNTIIQSYKAGGNTSEVLEAVGNNLKEIRKLRSEQESQIYGEMITGYVIYFVFLGVLVGLMRFLLPSIAISQPQASVGPIQIGGLGEEEMMRTYRSVFQFLIVAQAVFSGLVIGRLSEGELRAGAKHVAILLAVGYTVSAFFL